MLPISEVWGSFSCVFVWNAHREQIFREASVPSELMCVLGVRLGLEFFFPRPQRHPVVSAAFVERIIPPPVNDLGTFLNSEWPVGLRVASGLRCLYCRLSLRAPRLPGDRSLTGDAGAGQHASFWLSPPTLVSSL